MRMPWSKSKAEPLSLLDALTRDPIVRSASADPCTVSATAGVAPLPTPFVTPLQAPPSVSRSSYLWGACMRTQIPRKFPAADIDKLAQGIRQHGILQPIVVHPAEVGRSSVSRN